MDHTQAQERFSEYWEKSLSPAAAEEVAAHLRECPACQAEYAAFTEAMAPLAKLHKVAAPDTLPEAVPEIIGRRSQGRYFGPFYRRAGWGERMLPWMSFFMLLLIAVIYALMKWSQPSVQVR